MRYKLRSTQTFAAWIDGLKDRTSRARILRRIDSMAIGHFGDHKTIRPGLFELRFFFGPGFRVYYTIRDNTVILLLAGGDKSTQARDIDKATKLLADLEGQS